MTAPTRLFLIRHGEVEGDGVLHGHVDVPLTARGRRQMEAVAERLAGESIVRLYCSDLQRSLHSARIVGDPGGTPVCADPAFREMDMGHWDNRPLRQLWREAEALLRQWWRDLENFRVPGGESLAAVRERVLPALGGILERHAGETLALVAHGGVNRVILLAALDTPLGNFHRLEQDYACVNLIEYHADGHAVIKLLNG